jgi:hypothetical protein
MTKGLDRTIDLDQGAHSHDGVQETGVQGRLDSA